MEITYQTAYNYLDRRKYPFGSNKNQNQATQNKAKKFIIQDGVLHYITKSGVEHWISKPEQHPKITIATMMYIHISPKVSS